MYTVNYSLGDSYTFFFFVRGLYSLMVLWEVLAVSVRFRDGPGRVPIGRMSGLHR